MNSADLISDMASEDYHALPRISQSAIKLFQTDPGKYHARYVLGEQPTTKPKHFIWGQDFENLIFDNHLPGVVIPQDVLARSERDGKPVYSRRGPAFNEFVERMTAEHGPDVRLLKQEEWERDIQPLLLARDQLRSHVKASKLLDGTRHQVALWDDEETGLPCKAQFDVISRFGTITDLKTAASAAPEEFNRSVFKFGYHKQAAWYRRAYQRVTGERRPFAFVVVQSSPSYFCEAYTLSDDWLELGEQQVTAGLRRLADAKASDNWHSDTWGQVVELRPLPWMTRV